MLLRTLTGLFLLFISAFAKASDREYIYRLKIVFDQGTSVQAGFLTGEHGGVVTALHGVIGAKRIVAEDWKGQAVTDIRLAGVDVGRDLALLRAPVWEGRSGFRLEAAGTTVPGASLRAVGSPYGIELYSKKVEANGWDKLSRRIPPKIVNAFTDRRSPATDQQVLILDGPLTAGYSGGPILNSAGDVVAVINGGVKGEADIAWAIPAKSAVWQDPKAATQELERLKKLGPGHLFSTLPDPTARSTVKLSVRFPVAIERVYMDDSLLWHPTLKDKRSITWEANEQWNLKAWEGQSTHLRFYLEPNWATYVTQLTARADGILDFRPKFIQVDTRAAMGAFTGKWTYDSEFKYGLVGSIESNGFRLRGARDGRAVWDMEDAPAYSSREYNFSYFDLDIVFPEDWFRRFIFADDGEIYNHTKQTITYRNYSGSNRTIETDIWFSYNQKTRRPEIELRNEKFKLKYK